MITALSAGLRFKFDGTPARWLQSSKRTEQALIPCKQLETVARDIQYHVHLIRRGHAFPGFAGPRSHKRKNAWRIDV